MNVINFSGGGPQTDPANDAMYETIHNTVARRRRAGDRRRQRPRGLRPRHGRLAGDRAGRDLGRRRPRTPTSSLPRSRVVGGPPSLGAIPIQGAGGAKLPGAWATLDQTDRRRLVDRGHRRQARRGASLRVRRPIRTPASARCPRTRSRARSCSSRAASARSSRRRSARLLGGAIGIILVDNRFGEANAIPIPLPIAGRDDLRPRRPAAARVSRRERRPGDDPRHERHPGDPDEPRRRDHELLVGRADRLRAHAQARHVGARARRPLLHAAEDDRRDVLGLRRNVDGDAARRRRGGAAPAAASGLDALARSSRR